MTEDYYAVLGIDPQADLLAIKRAYRTKAIIAHPDRGGSHEAMLQLNEAYEILANPQLRIHYDDARANLANQWARQQAESDAAKARQQAGQYPPRWTDFESWLAKDFMDAEYGESGWLPTVNNSSSGVVFILVGLIIGVFIAYYGHQQYGWTGKGLVVMPFLFGFIGQCIHKQIGKSLRNQSMPPGTPADPQKVESAAHEKGIVFAVVAGIIVFIILVAVCRGTVGDGIFSEQESFINWPGVVIGTGVCAFLAYWVGKSQSPK